jgi:dUTP pyrophosphatase
MDIRVKKLSSKGTVPTKANASDAGWDLYSSEDAIIDPSNSELISTDIAMAIPDGYVGLIWDRSSMAAKRGLHRFAGVIDSGYRGEIKVCLWNSSDKYSVIKAGERVAQLLFHRVPSFSLKEVESLDDTERGKGGFGSSGL